MRRFLERMDALMAAIAFAEEGEADTARRILAESRRDEDATER
jgi:hypothetical protein